MSAGIRYTGIPCSRVRERYTELGFYLTDQCPVTPGGDQSRNPTENPVSTPRPVTAAERQLVLLCPLKTLARDRLRSRSSAESRRQSRQKRCPQCEQSPPHPRPAHSRTTHRGSGSGSGSTSMVALALACLHSRMCRSEETARLPLTLCCYGVVTPLPSVRQRC